MSRVVELHEGLSKDPAYAWEFARLEEELAQLKTLVRTKVAKATVSKTERATPASDTVLQARKRSA